MKPSPTQYFLAHGFKVSTAVGSLTAAALTGGACGAFSLWAAIAVLVALPLGWILGALFLFPYVFAIASKINGAPFHEGGLVHILVGPYRDRVGRIYSIWRDRNQVRVAIGEPAKKDLTDLFSHNEVCREQEA